MLSAVAGFVAGLVHVFSGPDHLTAVAPLVAVERRGTSKWVAGAKWGGGHAAGVILIGVLLIWFRELLPIEQISAWSEQLVGLMLIAIGAWGIRLALSRRLHAHEHQHEGASHVHIHCHKDPEEKHQSHVHSHAAFGIGTLHGLAGSSHFFGVLPALAFPGRSNAITYLVAYALGTIVGMSLFSAVAGWISECVSKSGFKAYRTTVFSCSLLAVGVGVWWCLGH